MRGTSRVITTLVAGLALGAAQAQAPVSGTLSIGEKQYKLGRGVSYPVKAADEARIAVLVSDRNLPIGEIKQALAEDGNDDSLFVSQPHVKLIFKLTGELESCSCWADNSSFSTGGDDLSGKLQLSDDRATGEAKLAADEEGRFQRSFEFTFDLPLGLDVEQPKPKRAGPVKPKVSGEFIGNGKPAKLAFVTARRGEPFNDKPSIELVFTEQSPGQDKQARNKASFGDYGSALVISCHEDGGIFGCQIVHQAHEKQGFTSLGRMRMGEFELGDDFVAGQLTTDGEDEFFDDRWTVDVRFEAPLPAAAKPAAKPAAKKPSRKPEADEESEDDSPAPAEPTGAKLKVRELALPKNAKNLQYKALVEQFTFDSPAKVQALAADLTKQLAGQGWKKDGSDLVAPGTAILQRKQGEATLRIIIKPEGAGSQALVFVEGMDWEE